MLAKKLKNILCNESWVKSKETPYHRFLMLSPQLLKSCWVPSLLVKKWRTLPPARKQVLENSSGGVPRICLDFSPLSRREVGPFPLRMKGIRSSRKEAVVTPPMLLTLDPLQKKASPSHLGRGNYGCSVSFDLNSFSSSDKSLPSHLGLGELWLLQLR